MKILCTGNLGFIGTNFTHYILNKYSDYEVIGLDKCTYAANYDNSKDLESNPNYSFVKGDICDKSLVERFVEQSDTVCHFAAESHVDRSILAPGTFLQTNVIGTQVLLDACVKYSKRFHHVSTDEVFGSLSLDSKEKFNENSPYDPSSPYSASKAASDLLVRAYCRTYGLKATISNSSNNYGKYQHQEKLIPTIIFSALENRKIPVYGNGLNVRDWVHVLDHCEAIDLIIHKGKIGESYCVGGNEEWSNIDLVKKILRIMRKPESLINFVTDRKGHDLRYAVDSLKIEKELGWKRKFTFDSGLRQTIDWYESRFLQSTGSDNSRINGIF